MSKEVSVLIRETTDLLKLLQIERGVDSEKVKHFFRQWKETGVLDAASLSIDERSALVAGTYMVMVLEWLRAQESLKAAAQVIAMGPAPPKAAQPAPADPGTEKVVDAILEHIHRSPPDQTVYPKDIAQALGMPVKTIRDAMDRLVAEGILESDAVPAKKKPAPKKAPVKKAKKPTTKKPKRK